MFFTKTYGRRTVIAKKLSYERYFWFHGRVKAGVFPNSACLADHFQISRKQAQRDVGFMRDRIDAPCSTMRTAGATGMRTRPTNCPPRRPPPWIAEQEWHEAQEVSVGKDGSLRLRFPVSGFGEAAREILKYGAAGEVLEPKELRDTIREEIRKMGT
ncbi:MAG: WYL domain-containing protein, partial [Proteobacteria bacterium]|nr:WYL domain-containing protein [Pseudomonadota bacterium]